MASPAIMKGNLASNLLKRNIESISSSLQNNVGKAGVRIEAFIASILPAKEKKATSKKAPPRSFIVVFLSPTTQLNYIKKLENGDTGPGLYEVKQYTYSFVSMFDFPTGIEAGSVVLLGNPTANEYNGRISLNVYGITVLRPPSFEVVSTLPVEIYRPPTLSEIATRGNVILPINIDSLAGSVCGSTFGNEDPKTYISTRDNVVKMSAYIAENRGYPFIVRVDDTQQILCVMKLYENHLENFGITDLNMWPKFAPLLFESMIGVICGYVDVNDTRGLELNNNANSVYSTSETSSDFSYALTVKVTRLELDLHKMIKRIGFEVSEDYVTEKFDDGFLESDYSQKNVLYKKKDTSNIICLNEYTGKMDKFFTDEWSFYSLVNISTDILFNEDVQCIRDEYSIEDREDCLKSFVDKSVESKYTLEYTDEYMFAVKN